MAPPTRNPPIYLDDTGNPTTPPPAPAPAPPPAATSGSGFGAAGRGEDPAQYIQAWQRQFGFAPTAASLDHLVNSLRAEGWVNAKRADHNGSPSNDKIDLGNGQSADVISSEGASNAAWSWQPYATDSHGGGGGDLSGFGVPATPYTSQPYTGPAYQTPATPATNTPFVAPTAVTMENDPGFQFRRDQGNQGIQRSAAAQGSILSGGTQKALAQYNQDYASNEFQNVFNRALGTQQQNVGQEAAQVGNYNTQYTNRYNDYLNQNTRTLGDYLTNYNVQRGGSTDFYNLYYNPTQSRALQAAGSTGGQ